MSPGLCLSVFISWVYKCGTSVCEGETEGD